MHRGKAFPLLDFPKKERTKMSIKTKTESTMASGQLNAEELKVISMEFTMTELETLSSGILSMIEKTMPANRLVSDRKVHTSIDEYCTKLHALNIRICYCR